MAPNTAAGTSIRLRRNAFDAMREAMKTPSTLFQTFLKQYQPSEEQETTEEKDTDSENENPSAIDNDML
jgi:hypothetical protein